MIAQILKVWRGAFVLALLITLNDVPLSAAPTNSKESVWSLLFKCIPHGATVAKDAVKNHKKTALAAALSVGVILSLPAITEQVVLSHHNKTFSAFQAETLAQKEVKALPDLQARMRGLQVLGQEIEKRKQQLTSQSDTNQRAIATDEISFFEALKAYNEFFLKRKTAFRELIKPSASAQTNRATEVMVTPPIALTRLMPAELIFSTFQLNARASTTHPAGSTIVIPTKYFTEGPPEPWAQIFILHSKNFFDLKIFQVEPVNGMAIIPEDTTFTPQRHKSITGTSQVLAIIGSELLRKEHPVWRYLQSAAAHTKQIPIALESNESQKLVLSNHEALTIALKGWYWLATESPQHWNFRNPGNAEIFGKLLNRLAATSQPIP